MSARKPSKATPTKLTLRFSRETALRLEKCARDRNQSVYQCGREFIEDRLAILDLEEAIAQLAQSIDDEQAHIQHLMTEMQHQRRILLLMAEVLLVKVADIPKAEVHTWIEELMFSDSDSPDGRINL